MDSAGTGGADTDAETTAVFGDTGSHEGGSFFMAHRDVADAVLAFSQCFDNGIDPVTAEDMGCAPVDQSFDEDVRSIQIFTGVRALSFPDGCAAAAVSGASAAKPAAPAARMMSRRYHPDFRLKSLIAVLRAAPIVQRTFPF